MTFNYSEEQIAEIESIGMTVEDFDRILTNLSTAFGMWYDEVIKALRSLCNYISDAWEQMKELVDRTVEDIQTVEIRQQYKIVKRLGNANYCVYLNNNKLYRARSNI